MADGSGPAAEEDAEVRRALGAVSLQAARSLALWLAVLFALFIVTDWLLYDPPVDRVLAAYDAALAVLLLAFWLVARRDLVPAHHGSTAAGGLLLLVLPYLLTVLWLTGQ